MANTVKNKAKLTPLVKEGNMNGFFKRMSGLFGLGSGNVLTQQILRNLD